jgi:hypothetical protein
MIHSNRKFVIETLSEDHPEYSRARVKRDMSLVEDFDQNLVLIYETSGGKCGLKPYNMKKMHAPPLEESIRTLLTRDNVRVKRQTERGKALKAIEIAIFVDDDLYQKTESSGVKDPVKTIQDFVFAYLNSVSIMLLCFLARSSAKRRIMHVFPQHTNICSFRNFSQDRVKLVLFPHSALQIAVGKKWTILIF